MIKIGEYKINPTTDLRIILLLMSIPFLYDKLIYDISFLTMFEEFNVLLVMFIFLSLTFFIQHELIHYLFLSLFGLAKESKFGLTSISVDCDYIKKEHFIITVLSPLVLITLFYGTLSLIFNQYAILFLMVVILNIMGSKNDIEQAKHLIKYKGNIYLKGDKLDGKVIHVYKKE